MLVVFMFVQSPGCVYKESLKSLCCRETSGDTHSNHDEISKNFNVKG